MAPICLVPEHIKYKPDVTAQGSARYGKFLDQEIHQEIGKFKAITSVQPRQASKLFTNTQDENIDTLKNLIRHDLEGCYHKVLELLSEFD